MAGSMLATAFAGQAHADSFNLGVAAGFAGIGLTGVPVTISSGNTMITGNIGVSSGGNLNFSGGGQITGTIFNDPGAAAPNISGGSAASGGVVSQSMAAIDAAALNAYNTGTALTPTSNVGSIGNGASFTAAGTSTVIDVANGVSLSGGGTITLNGNASDFFVFNVSNGINMSGGSSIVLNGVLPGHILWDVIGSGGSSSVQLNGNSDSDGTYIAPNADIVVSGGVHSSEFISGTKLTFQSGPHISAVPLPAPLAAGVGLLGALGMVSVVRARRNRAV